MPARRTTLTSPRLYRLAQREATGRRDSPMGAGKAAAEQCELCGAPVPEEHRHLVDVASRQLLCACRACSLLFDRPAAARGQLRLVPDRRQRLGAFQLDDAAWERLRIPVDMAFFFYSSPAERTLAFYPGPMGATESRLELEAWTEIVDGNPVLATLAPDVEALLVNRARGTRGHWIVPVDDCYRLVALIRTRWRGFTGGREVWAEITRFFQALDDRARDVTAPDREPIEQPGAGPVPGRS